MCRKVSQSVAMCREVSRKTLSKKTHKTHTLYRRERTPSSTQPYNTPPFSATKRVDLLAPPSVASHPSQVWAERPNIVNCMEGMTSDDLAPLLQCTDHMRQQQTHRRATPSPQNRSVIHAMIEIHYTSSAHSPCAIETIRPPSLSLPVLPPVNSWMSLQTGGGSNWM